MDLVDVLVPIITLESDETALRTGAALAAQFGGGATAFIVGVGIGSAYADVESPLSEALLDLAAGAKSAAARERAAITNWIARHQPDIGLRAVTVESAATHDAIVGHARMADLVVMRASGKHGRARRELIEDVLFKSGRPLLLLPASFKRKRDWNRVLIAWNASTQAMRAIVGALPLLRAATQVRIVTIDAAPSEAGHGEAPGHELAAYLARRRVSAEIANLDGLGRDPAQRLEEAALDFDADMIVMGGYGHSRAREFVLGGVTRELLGGSRFPLLLAH
jgi:nucleotide-binding universal stress UspA family protein